MWIGIIILGEIIGALFLMRFFQAVDRWDAEIEAMEQAHDKKGKK